MAKSAPSANELEYTVRVYNEGIQKLEGDIISFSDGIMSFRYRKPGSSAYAMRHIPESQIVGYSKTSVLFKGRVMVLNLRHAQVEPAKGGMLNVTYPNTKGEYSTMLVRVADCESIAEKGVAVPGEVTKAKKVAAPVAKAAAPVAKVAPKAVKRV